MKNEDSIFRISQEDMERAATIFLKPIPVDDDLWYLVGGFDNTITIHPIRHHSNDTSVRPNISLLVADYGYRNYEFFNSKVRANADQTKKTIRYIDMIKPSLYTGLLPSIHLMREVAIFPDETGRYKPIYN